MPGWPTTGADIVPSMPPSQQGAADSQAGPQAGSHTGAHAGAAAPHGAAAGDPQERNSMNDGRRQLLPPPRQLLQPGAAARLITAVASNKARVMTRSPSAEPKGQAAGGTACSVVADDATETVPHGCGAAGSGTDFFRAGRPVVPASAVVPVGAARVTREACERWCGIRC